MHHRWFGLAKCLLLCLISGCAGEVSSGKVADATSVAAPLAATVQSDVLSPSSSASPALPRRIIKEGELRFETKDRSATHRDILKLVSSHQACVSEDRENRSDFSTEQTLVVRIPAAQFDAFLENISRGIESFDVRRIEALDLTDQFVDIEARLMTKKETESRYRELLKQANAVEDILKIEEQVDKLRAEIESAEGRLRLLQDRESFSTLSITFYQLHFASSDFGNRMQASLAMGWRGVIEATILFAALWPLLTAGLISAMIVWYLRRRQSAPRKTS
jgi:hypothetical protein